VANTTAVVGLQGTTGTGGFGSNETGG